MESSRAILLRKTRLTETSLILSWLSEREGRVKTVAKGALRPGSPWRGKLDIFFLCDMARGISKRSDLHPLRDVALLNAFPGLRTEYSRLQCAAYFVGLTEHSTEPGHAVPEIFDLLLRALHHLDKHNPNRRTVDFFEKELARTLGIHDGIPTSAPAGPLLLGGHSRLSKARTELMAAIAPTESGQ